MASDKQSYVIRIQYDTPDGSPAGEAPDRGADSGKGKADVKQTPNVTPAAVIQPFVSTALQMQTQRVNTVTGSGQLARKQQLINSITSTAVDMGTKALGGASVAASLGMAGGPVGAAVGVAMAAVSECLKIATSMADLKNKQEVENTAIAATRARAGISWDRSRGR